MRYAIIALLATLISAASFNAAGDFTIHGFVFDPSGAPIPNATVCVKGTKSCTTTAQDGSFSLKVNSKKTKLNVAALGYDRKEIKIVPDGKLLVVNLNPTTQYLNDAVLSEEREPAPVSRKSLRGAIMTIRQKNMGRPNYTITDKKDFYQKNKEKVKNEDEEAFNTEEYEGITENRFLLADNTPLSTFSIDVDGASYANARRFLDMGQLPPPGSVRIEEFINYFHYDYPQPKGEDPFSINTEIVDCPWQPENKLVMIGLQGKKIPTDHLPASNLVFLVDVSGSMDEPNKLPLVKTALKLLVDQLREKDRVSLVVYAGNAGLVLPSTPGDEKEKIKDAIDNLDAGGSTAGGAGIQLAYKVAKQNFVKEGNNRVILCTDGDFNVGVSSDAALESMIEKERKSGVYLTVLGFGMGNYKDSKMQKLADKGNGNHSYIDNLNEARKVLVSEFGGTLFTIAKDVKLQVEFNPAKVRAYRLIGYENRILNKEDFNNDQKDAGDLGSGHTVTALYEIVPVGIESKFIEKTDPLKYQKKNGLAMGSEGNEILTIKFRFKKPDEEVSKLIEHPVIDHVLSIANASANFQFAASVAEFGMLLMNSEFKEQSSFENVSSMAKKGLGADEEGYRAQFLSLVKNAASLVKNKPAKEKLARNDR